MGKRQGEDNEPPEEEERGSRPQGPKYGPPIEPPPPTALDRLTPREWKRLATLVKKYGVRTVVDAARLVGPSRRRGAPRKAAAHSRLEGIALAELFDELVEEHRAEGRRYPGRDAMRELFLIAHPSFDPDPISAGTREQFDFPRPIGNPDDAYRRFASTTKRKLAQGRRDLKAAKERAAAAGHYRAPRKTRAKKSRE